MSGPDTRQGRTVVVLSVAAIAVTVFVASSFWRAARTLEKTLSDPGKAAFAVAVSDFARPSPIPFEPVAGPSGFRDAALFLGGVWLAGGAGLFGFDDEGVLLAGFHTGLDLPPARAVALSVSGPALWIATDGEGLLEFDGRRIRHIRPELLSARKLTSVLALPDGRVLAGSDKHGVLAWDGSRLAFLHPSLSTRRVTALAGKEAGLWVGTSDEGVLHFHAGQLDSFGEAEGLPDPHVLSLAVSGDDAWVGTAVGVAEFRDGRFALVLAQGVFARALAASPGRLLIGTLEDGVVEIPLAAGRPGTVRTSAGFPMAVERLVRSGEESWALAADGLYAVDRHAGGWKRLLTAERSVLADRNVSALAVDPDGRLWVGYFDRGLEILEAGGARFRRLEDDHMYCVNRIVHDPRRGETAVATANGLVMFDSFARPRQVLGRNEGLIGSHVTDVALLPSGMVVATPAGLTFLEAGGARSLYAFHGLVNNHAYAVAAWGDRVLAGTLGGLSELEGGVVRASYTTANSGLRHNWITAVARVGEEWFAGTYGAGVFRLDSSGQWRGFDDLREGFEVNPNAMLVTDSAVYAGSLSGGLYVYSRPQGRWSSVVGGLPSANVTALAARGGILYVGTDNGLVRVPENAILTR